MIRQATLDDVPELEKLAVIFYKNDSKYKKHIPLDIEKTSQTFINLISLDDGIIFVAEKDGRITGMLGLIASYHIFSDIPQATELFWFVDPEKRGCGVRLLKAAETWAKDVGVKQLFFGSVSKKTERTYRTLGFNKLATYHVKDL